MITVRFNNQYLKTKFFIVKINYVTPLTKEEITGLDILVESKLSLEEVASIVASYKKDGYKAVVEEIETTKKFPAGYYESCTIDNAVTKINRLRFIEHNTIEVPKVVYIKKTISKEL